MCVHPSVCPSETNASKKGLAFLELRVLKYEYIIFIMYQINYENRAYCIICIIHHI